MEIDTCFIRDVVGSFLPSFPPKRKWRLKDLKGGKGRWLHLIIRGCHPSPAHFSAFHYSPLVLKIGYTHCQVSFLSFYLLVGFTSFQDTQLVVLHERPQALWVDLRYRAMESCLQVLSMLL